MLATDTARRFAAKIDADLAVVAAFYFVAQHSLASPPAVCRRTHARRGRNKPIRSVAFVSLGCPKNLVDSERMLGLLAEDGLAITPDAADADAIVINTCGFLEASKDESLEEIREADRA